MKSLMEKYTVQIKLFQCRKQEILRRQLSMRSFKEQVTESSELSVEGLKVMEDRLKRDFLEVSQVLQSSEQEWMQLLEKVSSKVSTKDVTSSDKSTQPSTPSSKEQEQS